MNKLRQLLALLLAAAMMLSLAACGDASHAPGKTDEDNETSTEEVEMDETTVPNVAYKVALITDSSVMTDPSFNQMTYEAAEAFCEANGIEFQSYQPDSDRPETCGAKVDGAVADGYNILILTGHSFGDTIVAKSGLYPDVKFVALDVTADDILAAAVGDDYDYNPDNWDVTRYYNTENVFCGAYQEEIAGYMAGYAAVKMGYRHLGFLGSVAIPAVIRYGYGYLQGADAAAMELEISDQVTVKYAYAGQSTGNEDLTAAMDTWYQGEGVEVVFACGGNIDTSVAEAAAKADGKVIGADTDRSRILDSTYGQSLTITSAMVRVTPVVDMLLSAIVLKGNWDDYVGQIQNLGLVSGDDPTLNYVQLPMETTQWNEGFAREDYQNLVSRLYSGEMTVSADTTMMPMTTITVKNAGNILSAK